MGSGGSFWYVFYGTGYCGTGRLVSFTFMCLFFSFSAGIIYRTSLLECYYVNSIVVDCESGFEFSSIDKLSRLDLGRSGLVYDATD